MLALLLLLPLLCCEADLSKAILSYERGEKTTDLIEKNKAYNDALEEFLVLESPSGMLLYNIANTYYKLGEFPRAILYYLRAQELAPRDENIQENLKRAAEQLGLPTEFSPPLFASSDLYQVFFFSTLLFCALSSIFIWRGGTFLRKLLMFTALLPAVSLSLLFYSSFIKDPEALVILPTYLHRLPDIQTEVTSLGPILPGQAVSVLDLSQDGNWSLIVTKEGKTGYIEISNLRLYK